MKRITILAVVGLLLVAPVVPAFASNVVSGNPVLGVSVADETFQSNEEARLTVVASNDGNIEDGGARRVEGQGQTARSVRMQVDDDQVDAPIDVKTGTVTAGSIGPGGTAEFSFDVDIGNAEPGRYTVPVEITYRHARAVLYDETSNGPANVEYTWLEKERTVDLTIRIEERAEFDVISEGSNELIAGETGSLALTIENTGRPGGRRSGCEPGPRGGPRGARTRGRRQPACSSGHSIRARPDGCPCRWARTPTSHRASIPSTPWSRIAIKTTSASGRTA